MILVVMTPDAYANRQGVNRAEMGKAVLRPYKEDFK
jgi:hypothetical protein